VANDLITPSTVNGSAMWEIGAVNQKTLTVAPANLGDLMVMTSTHATSQAITLVSGGGCPASNSGLPGAWTRIAGPFANSSSAHIEMWMGRVTTTGSQTLTLTINNTGNQIRINCKEFGTGGGAGTVWTQDGSPGTRANTSATTTVTFPSLTPSGPNRLYIGFGTNGTGNVNGATAGYTVELDPGTNPVIYDASVPQSAQAPTSVTTSNVSYTVAALIKADNPVTDTGRFLPFFV